MKTFVALSMALSIGAGHYWCGKTTKKGRVLYVAAEGLSGLRVRSQAYRQAHRINAAEIRLMGEGLNLRDPDDLRQVRRCLEDGDFRPDLIVIDTLARSIPGADENSSQDMGEVVCAVDELRRATSATALLVHHTEKKGEAERGSSALRGAAELMIKCKKNNRTLVSLECSKMKDAEDFVPLAVRLQSIQLTTGPTLAVTECQNAPERNAGHHEELMQILRQHPAGLTYVEWLNGYTESTGLSKSTFDRTIKELKNNERVRRETGKYYLNEAS